MAYLKYFHYSVAQFLMVECTNKCYSSYLYKNYVVCVYIYIYICIHFVAFPSQQFNVSYTVSLMEMQRAILSLWVEIQSQQVCAVPMGVPGGSDGKKKNLLATQETRVQSLGQEDPLEQGMNTHSSILAWRIPWTEEPGRLQSMGSQKVRHN